MFKKKNFLRHECEPGKQPFWASSENKEFITADLVAGESYIVIMDVIMGGLKPRVGLKPISVKNAEIFARAKELIEDENPIVETEDVLKKKNEKLSPFITENLMMYNNIWKDEHQYKHISSDMALPADAMK